MGVRRKQEDKTHRHDSSEWWKRFASLLRDYFFARMADADTLAATSKERLVEEATRWGVIVGGDIDEGARESMLAYSVACMNLLDAAKEKDLSGVDKSASALQEQSKKNADILRCAIEEFPGDAFQVGLAEHASALASATAAYLDGDKKAYQKEEKRRMLAANKLGHISWEWLRGKP